MDGAISNAGFVVGDQAVVVFDVQADVEIAKKQLAEIAKVTSKPVNT